MKLLCVLALTLPASAAVVLPPHSADTRQVELVECCYEYNVSDSHKSNHLHANVDTGR